MSKQWGTKCTCKPFHCNSYVKGGRCDDCEKYCPPNATKPLNSRQKRTIKRQLTNKYMETPLDKLIKTLNAQQLELFQQVIKELQEIIK